MHRVATLVCVVALAGTACAAEDLGRDPIWCRIDPQDPSASVVLTLQAVPTAEYIPCIAETHVGWEFDPMTAEYGRSRYVVDSDRLGSGFLVVTLLDACDTDGAVRSQGSEPGTQFWVDVHEEVTTTNVAILAIANRHRDFAAWIAAFLRTRTVHGLQIDPTVSYSTAPVSDRIVLAQPTTAVIAVDDDSVREGTAGIVNRDGSRDVVDVDELFDRIAERSREPVYRATWYYTFPGGCVEMDIDAEGREASTVADEIDATISMYDTTEVRQVLVDAGYESVG